MIKRKGSWVFLRVVITALLMALTLGVASGSSHVITDQEINVGPDGYWDAEVAAGGHQNWNFVIGADREHKIEIEIESPAGASLGVSVNGADLGTVTGDSIFTVNLAAGSHVVRIDNPGNAPVQYEFYMGASVHLGFTKEFINDPVPPGGTTTLQFTLKNNDSFNVGGATGIAFTDDLGGVLSDLKATDLPKNDVCGPGSVFSGTTILTLTGGDLPPFGQCTFDVTLDVPQSAAPGTYTNFTSQLSGTINGQPLDSLNPASDDLEISKAEFADLVIEKTDSLDPVNPGGQLEYKVSVNNNGPSNALNVVVTDTLPAGVTPISTNGCAEDPNGIPACSLGTITAGGSKEYIVTVAVHASTSGIITNVASVTSDTPEGNPGDESTFEDTKVQSNEIRSVGGVTSFLAGGSGTSSGIIALLAAAGAAAILLGGSWYARRRGMGKRS